jgi:hypothetical protein
LRFHFDSKGDDKNHFMFITGEKEKLIFKKVKERYDIPD